MVNKYLAQEKRVFDINKFTVVGSPTITSDGVASGFSSSNLIYKDVDLANKSFVIETPVYHYSQTSSADQYIISVGTYNNKLLLQARILASGKISIGVQNDTTPIVADANTNAVLGNTYQIKFVLNTTKAEIYLKTNNNNYELVKSAVNNSLYTLNNNRLYIGNAYVGASQSFLGSIDLTKFKITVDNQTVFTGTKPVHLLERRKEGFDSSKFTVVGSPTITEAGVASGLTANNYVKVSISLTSPFTLNYKFNSGNSNEVTNAKWALGFENEHCSIYCNANSSTVTVEYDANDETHKYSSFGQLNANTDYEWVFNIDGSNTYMTIKNLTLGTENTYKLPLFKESFICSGVLLKNFCSGSINLPSISITVDDKEVFTGAKESYYVLRS